MSKGRAIVILIFLTTVLGGGPSCGEDPAGSGKDSGSVIVVVFAVDPTWPPMEFHNNEGELVGYSIDFMNEAGRVAKFTPVFRAVAWEGIFDGLMSGKYDAVCSSVSITSERKERMDFSDPYFRVRQALVVRSDAAWRSLNELAGKKVGAQVNTTGADAIENAGGAVLAAYAEVGPAMMDLRSGRIEGVVCDDPVAADFALSQEAFRDHIKIVAVVETEEVEYYGIAVRKGDRRLLGRINQGIAAVRESGGDKALLKKWIGQ